MKPNPAAHKAGPEWKSRAVSLSVLAKERSNGDTSGWFFHPAESTLPLEPASLFTNLITSRLAPHGQPANCLPGSTAGKQCWHTQYSSSQLAPQHQSPMWLRAAATVLHRAASLALRNPNPATSSSTEGRRGLLGTGCTDARRLSAPRPTALLCSRYTSLLGNTFYSTRFISKLTFK